jgi:hypothetical protein
VNLSLQDTVVITTALIGAMGNAYLFVVAVHDGHRGLYRAAGVAFFIFSLVAAVFFQGRCEVNIGQARRLGPAPSLALRA